MSQHNITGSSLSESDQQSEQKMSAAEGQLAALDTWMNHAPWHPRMVPFVVYVGFLVIISAGVSYVGLWTYPVLYVLQCSLVLWLLVRYRKLLSELNWKFHWSAVPSGLFLTFAWIALGKWMSGLSQAFNYSEVEHDFDKMAALQGSANQAMYWSSISLRLLGMSIVVPMFEELFTRSLCLRALHSWKATWLGIKQVLHDLPGVGDWFMHTQAGKAASVAEPAFTSEFERTKLGDVSVFAIVASTLVFMASHVPRDWPGCIACGVIWCLMVKWTNREGKKQYGLGPVIWSHGITNAALWGYCMYVGSWEFL
ncbi:CPBP family glutamic-type intramembrane protease [Poriferisphaera sp. WC338]|uniref:CPBP family glutamic-type intramembrane protease n=1 Tax=Poriferisphaera sp. WC338 TaxID=3425129 RepID=UPI003D818B16